MKFLRGLGLTLLSLLLFLSLYIFGLAFLLNNTVLSPKFITSEVDRLDVSSLAEEVISQQIPEEELPEELRAVLADTIPKVEPLLKEQVSAATYSIFDYLLGKRESPDLAQTLHNTLLSSDFIVSIVDELDIASLAKEIVSEQFAGQIPEEMEFMTEYMDDVIVELEPWIKEQIGVVADPVVGYLLGESQSLNVVIPLEPAVEIVRDSLREALLESPPAEFADLPPSLLAQQFDAFFQEFSEGMPSTFELDESLLGTELRTEIASALASAEGGLGEARQYVSYFQLGYKLLIGFIVLLILGIVLIHRRVKGASRGLGITFLTYGVPWYVGTFVAKYFAGTQMAQLDIPPYLEGWLPQLVDNFLAPLEMFSLGLLIGGVALIVVSFVYKPREPSF